MILQSILKVGTYIFIYTSKCIKNLKYWLDLLGTRVNDRTNDRDQKAHDIVSQNSNIFVQILIQDLNAGLNLF